MAAFYHAKVSFCFVSLLKQLIVRNATNGFPTKWRLLFIYLLQIHSTTLQANKLTVL